VADPVADGAYCDGAPSDNPFTDIGAETAGTRQVILCLVATGLTTGTTRTTYTPGGTVTRRQMALFIARLADFAKEHERADLQALPAYDGTVGFTDVAADDPGARAIRRLARAQIVGGFPDGTYRPNSEVTRRQMAAFVNRLQEFLTGEPFAATREHFDDLGNESEESAANLNAMAEVGIFQGDGQRRVTPGGNLTRRQMANILLRHLQVNYSRGVVDSPFNPLGHGVTVLPELIRAERLGTVTEEQATDTNPVGTRVRFVFDQELQSTTAASFKVYSRTGTATASAAGTSPQFPVIEASGRSVIARFPAVATQALADDLTVAAVARGAVVGTAGGQNPEGSAPIGTAATVRLFEPRTTSAPDLLAITAFRPVEAVTFPPPPRPAGTAIDLTFDQNAYSQDPGGSSFELIGRTAGTGTVCSGPNPLQTSSGGSGPGGSGTSTFTIFCPGTWTAANTARVLVPAGEVFSSAAGGVGNVVQVTQTGAAQDVEGRPNLVSVFRVPALTGDVAEVIFTFDTPVRNPVANRFGIYAAGAVSTVGLADPAPTIGTVNPRQVIVRFPRATVDVAVGGYALGGAVESVANGQTSLLDEAGVENPATAQRVPGRTDGPDLVSVALSNPGGAGFVALYTFDAPIAQGGTPFGSPTPASLVLYAADGTRLTCTNAAARTYGTGADSNRVMCNAFTVGGQAATSAQIGASVLGAVAAGAAFTPVGTGNVANPEGGVPTTGGTGTPAR
jgi:hypothetical protein